MRQFLILILLGTLPLTGLAAVYKWVDEQGRTVYSDRPPSEEAEEAKLPPVETLQFKKPAVSDTAAPAAPSNTTGKKPGKGYNSLTIVSPAHDSTVRENTGRTDIELSLDPALRPGDGHTLTLIIDGVEMVTQSVSLKFVLHNVDRGSHTIQAKVVDGEGQDLIFSDIITFHMQRTTAPQINPTPSP